MVNKYTQMQIIGEGKSTPNADYRRRRIYTKCRLSEERIYTKCRLSEGANLHQMQIIGRGESTPNADYRKEELSPGRGETHFWPRRGRKRHGETLRDNSSRRGCYICTMVRTAKGASLLYLHSELNGLLYHSVPPQMVTPITPGGWRRRGYGSLSSGRG